jgi:hypothetical protein
MRAPCPLFRLVWTGDFRLPDDSPRFSDVGLFVLAGTPFCIS